MLQPRVLQGLHDLVKDAGSSSFVPYVLFCFVYTFCFVSFGFPCLLLLRFGGVSE